MLKKVTGLLLAVSLAALAQHDHGAAPGNGPAPLLNGMGHLHHAVATSNPLAQKYFDQGLTLVYGFNHDEAVRSFAYAAKLDPKCAMAYWGIALARGPNYNEWFIDAAREKASAEAIQKAQSLASGGSPAEQDYIRAFALRVSADPKANQTKMGEAYRDAMRQLMQRYPNDPDAAVLFAESNMVLHAWKLWKRDGTPEAGTMEAIAALESVLKRDTNNIGANHFYVHALEASPHPEQAMASAQRMADLTPGAGHLVHMPAHIYIRTGDYHAASVSNKQAIGADEGYIDKYHVDGMYSAMYYTHNMHFLASAASMEGNFADASRVAARITKGVKPYLSDSTETMVLVRFHRWQEVERLPEPAKNLAEAHALWRFARGMALAGKGDGANSEAERTQFAAEVKSVPRKTEFNYNTTGQIFDIAQWILDAATARAKHDYKQSAALLTKAALAEDALNYDEPPDWDLPPRESLGAVLFLDGRVKEAEAAFREELKNHPKNPRALYGLAECLRAQRKTAEETEVRKQFEEGWKHADIQLRMEDL
jgi:tetratricopeptide (TPR) repeat protein